MPRSGGESDKLGNRYEGLWTVHNLIDVLAGDAVALQPESYEEAIGVEFIKTLRDNSEEFHSVIRPDMQEGEPCGKCSTPVTKRSGKRKPGRDYYYEFHLICPKCLTTYHIESAKRFVEHPPSLF